MSKKRSSFWGSFWIFFRPGRGGAYRFGSIWADDLVIGQRHINTPRIYTEGQNASPTPIPRSMGPFVKYAHIKSSF